MEEFTGSGLKWVEEVGCDWLKTCPSVRELLGAEWWLAPCSWDQGSFAMMAVHGMPGTLLSILHVFINSLITRPILWTWKLMGKEIKEFARGYPSKWLSKDLGIDNLALTPVPLTSGGNEGAALSGRGQGTATELWEQAIHRDTLMSFQESHSLHRDLGSGRESSRAGTPLWDCASLTLWMQVSSGKNNVKYESRFVHFHLYVHLPILYICY